MISLFAFIPMTSDSSDGAQFGIDGGQTLFGPGDTLAADADNGITIVTDGTIYRATMKVVDSNGTTQSGAVSPTTFSPSTSTPNKGLAITAPTTPGNYKIVVTFELTDGGEKIDRTYPIKVVEPIVLSVTLKNDTNAQIVGLSVHFKIDGKEMEQTDDLKNLTIGANSTKTVTYKWVVDNPSEGRHTYQVVADKTGAPPVNLDGLDETMEFYVGEKSYTWLTVIVVIILIIMIIVLLWIIRKPVKNFGKPKGRR